MSALAIAFRKMDPKQKALFLAGVAHEATIFARCSYAPSAEHPDRNFENPDAAILRDEINFVHRVVGYIPVVLKSAESEGQDESVIAMIEDHFHAHQASQLLTKWVKLSN